MNVRAEAAASFFMIGTVVCGAVSLFSKDPIWFRWAILFAIWLIAVAAAGTWYAVESIRKRGDKQ